MDLGPCIGLSQRYRRRDMAASARLTGRMPCCAAGRHALCVCPPPSLAERKATRLVRTPYASLVKDGTVGGGGSPWGDGLFSLNPAGIM
ncbi:hypothetical protein I6G97_11750 [Edwardsiella hoshinae]|uniref:hypothetical protein n=1 Tax=Edwardsiella hoshinae TaxID=93378 RepID=UPI000404ABB5|nr:hypothetical protein [Edwardsiella hoshinae]QPR27113.1 hypothetical protein I6G97_11750 [Edwardsiella hoshinae]